MPYIKSKILLLLFIILITSCSKSEQESIQGVWQCTGEKAKNISTMQVSGDQIIIEFARAESKPDIATFTLFEKGEKKWISIIEASKKADIQEYRLDGDNLSFYKAGGTLNIEFKR